MPGLKLKPQVILTVIPFERQPLLTNRQHELLKAAECFHQRLRAHNRMQYIGSVFIARNICSPLETIRRITTDNNSSYIIYLARPTYAQHFISNLHSELGTHSNKVGCIRFVNLPNQSSSTRSAPLPFIQEDRQRRAPEVFQSLELTPVQDSASTQPRVSYRY